jgi:hypothetical protein
MKLKHIRRTGTVIGFITAVLMYIVAFVLYLGLAAAIAGAGWLFVCGMVKLITLCFGWQFSWMVATGVWLVLVLIGSIFPS